MKYEKHIKELCKELRTFFFCDEYKMQLDHAKEDEEKHGKTKNAEIEIDPHYLNFTITFYPNLKRIYENKKYWEVANTLVHEFSHILTEPLYLLANEAASELTRRELEQTRERQTQRICNVIMSQLKPAFYLPKK